MQIIGKVLRYLFGRVLSLSETRVSRAMPRQIRGSARQMFLWLAVLHRARLRRVVFIGVTGSCGKTTTRELVAAVLSTQFKGRKNDGNNNIPTYLAQVIFGVK